MPRVKPLDGKGCKAFERADEGNPVATRKIKPAETPIRKHRITRNQCPFITVVKTDAARSMPWGMDDRERADMVPIGQKEIGGNTR